MPVIGYGLLDDECDLDALVSLLDDDSNSANVGPQKGTDGKLLDIWKGDSVTPGMTDTRTPQQGHQGRLHCIQNESIYVE